MAFISGGRLEGASGGTISTISGYNVHTFDKVGLNTFTPTTNGLIEVLVVGGGAAGSAQTGGSGGGGGGSVLYTKVVRVSAGVSYPVFVGAGGTNGSVGTDSTVGLAGGTIISYGGDVGIGSFGKIIFSSVPSSINEGSSGTFNVTTDKFPNGTTVFWTINNISTSNADFGVTSGSFIVNGDAGSFSVPIVNDQLVDNSETFTVSLRSDSPSGNILVTSPAVTINNTSLVTTASTTSLQEGSSVTFTTQAQGFADGTTLFYDIVGSAGITAADFTSNSLSGTYTVSSGVASTTLTPFIDGIEGDETFQLGAKTSAGGSILSLSPVITILGSLFPFTSFTFTNATAEGTLGPTLANLQSTYSAQSWASNTAYLNLFNSTRGYQRWIVPNNGTYRITASGAQGGGQINLHTGGFGARMQATISLVQNDFLIFVVGQRGGWNGTAGSAAGGAGGTFVFKNNLFTPILIAGGGGGASSINPGTSAHGKTTNTGGTSSNGNPGGTSGSGGNSSFNSGGGGAGLTGNGAWINTGGGGGNGNNITTGSGTGGVGGNCAASIGGSGNFNSLGVDQGGFGGGGGGEWCQQGSSGAGGGHSGGGAGNNTWSGGGGSFVDQSLATLIGTSDATFNGAGSFTNIGFNGTATTTQFSNNMGSVLVEHL